MAGQKVEETPAQQAQADYAKNMMGDYQQRWMPLQAKLTDTTLAMGQANSPERAMAKGRAAADVEASFAQASDKATKAMTNAGVGPGSSRFALATTGMGADKAQTEGLNESAADRAVTAQYLQGLSAITATGRGERAQVGNELQTQANMSAQQAQQDAAISSANRAGIGQLAGTAAGAAFGMYGGGAPSTPSPTQGVGAGGVNMKAPSDALMPKFASYGSP